MVVSTKKISVLPEPARISENTLIPIVSTNIETNKTDVSAIRDTAQLAEGTVFSSLDVALQTVANGESFFVYETGNTNWALKYRRVGNTSAPVLGLSGNQIRLPTQKRMIDTARLIDLGGADMIPLPNFKKNVGDYIDQSERIMNGVCPEDFTQYSTDTEQLKAAIAYAKANGCNVYLKSKKTYYLTGTESLDIDLGYFSFGCLFGGAKIDATGFTGTAALWVHSSIPYTGTANNHLNEIVGINLVGAIVSGQAGLILGNLNNDANGTMNGECLIRNCNIGTFDIRILCTNSTWRYKFEHCGITSGSKGTYAFYAPVGLKDSGESITFHDCKFYDNKANSITIMCSNFSVGMSGTSILNTPIEISAVNSVIAITGMSNIENPGAAQWYRYAVVTGTGCRLIISSSTVISNQPQLQTKPLFLVDTNNFIEFSHIRFIGNAYKFEGGDEGMRTWCEGLGFVTANACTGDITSGSGGIPIHRSLSAFFNFSFETGGATGTWPGWSWNTQGDPRQTAQCIPDAAKVGTYGMRLTSYGTLSGYFTQRCFVGQSKYFWTAIWLKILQGGTLGNVAGNITIAFFSKDGTSISGPTSNLPTLATDWTVYGSYLQGRIPTGATEMELSFRVREGAIIDLDAALINLS